MNSPATHVRRQLRPYMTVYLSVGSSVDSRKLKIKYFLLVLATASEIAGIA